MPGDMYRLASNPTRRRVLLSLLQGGKSFSDLMRSVSMDPEHDTGPFLYHMHRLEEVGLVRGKDGVYSLTASGLEVAEALTVIRRVLGEDGERPAEEAGLNVDRGCGRSLHEGGRTMGMRENLIVRLLRRDDVESVLEVLCHLDFYRRQIDHMREHLNRVACRGLDSYENNFVGEMDGKAVARMVVDTNYPPYSELAGLIVHPSYRGRGLGKALLTRFTQFAAERNAPVQYTIVDGDNLVAQSLYRGFGFEPGILDGFHEKGREICMFRFGDGSQPCEFLRRHPLGQLRTSSRACGQMALGGMEWTDPLTGAKLTLHTKGRRHLSMPRISRTVIHEGQVSIDAVAEEETRSIGPDHEGVFHVKITNNGNTSTRIVLRLLLPRGREVGRSDQPEVLKLGPMSTGERQFRIRMMPDFEVPALSFTTIVATCVIELREPIIWNSPLLVSAGFEDVRYSKREAM